MNIIKEHQTKGYKIEADYGECLIPAKYVNSDPRKPKTEELPTISLSSDELERIRKCEEKILKTRIKNFSEGVNIMENIQRVDIDLMEEAPSNWNYMPVPKPVQIVSLMASIEAIGLVNPIILLQHPKYDKFTIISGKSRVLALKNLYMRDKLDKYKYPTCFILKEEETDEFYLRLLMLDLNFSYRTIPQEVLIRMILERHELLKRSKQFRNDSNIAETLAIEFMMSTSSIYNYLALKKLCAEGMTLLLEKRITLQIARLMTRVNTNMQRMILENIDFEGLNSVLRMKYITKTDNLSLAELKKRIEESKKFMPEKTTFTLQINKFLLDKVINSLIDIKKYAVTTLAGKFKVDNIDQYCKIRYNEEDMKCYLEKKLVDEKLLDKLTVKTINALFSR